MGMAMKDVRDRLSDLVKRATYGGEQITFGPNHGDDVTLIATKRVRQLEARVREIEARLAELGSGKAEPVPFAGLQHALEMGALSTRPEPARSRRVLPDLADEVPISREERIRLGSQDTRVPTYRRARPRA